MSITPKYRWLRSTDILRMQGPIYLPTDTHKKPPQFADLNPQKSEFIGLLRTHRQSPTHKERIPADRVSNGSTVKRVKVQIDRSCRVEHGGLAPYRSKPSVSTLAELQLSA